MTITLEQLASDLVKRLEDMNDRERLTWAWNRWKFLCDWLRRFKKRPDFDGDARDRFRNACELRAYYRDEIELFSELVMRENFERR